MTGNRRTIVAGLTAAVAMLLVVNAGGTFADSLRAEALADAVPTLKLKASIVGSGTPAPPITIELFRWSTDVERAPLIAALSAPSPAPPIAAPAAPSPAGRAGRAAGRGGRAAAPPASPVERLTTAIKAAPTVGFIWSDGPTGYSIKYAWRSESPDTAERVVLITDRRLGANATSWPTPAASAADAQFTVVEMRIDGKGVGEAKSSLTSAVVVDAAANTLAIDKYGDAPVLLKVTR